MRKKKDIKFSILKLTAKQKEELEAKSKELGISMNQMIVFAAVTALKIKVEGNPTWDNSVQIRLPLSVHSELQEKANKLNMDMTDLIRVGLKNSFSLKAL